MAISYYLTQNKQTNTSKMKLEIKHLAPYFPYALKCQAMGEHTPDSEYSDNPIPKIFEIQGFSDTTVIDLHEKDRTVNEQYDIDECFPVLRQFSDLIKEITFEGEKIIPLVELAKLEYPEIINSVLDIDYLEDKHSSMARIFLELKSQEQEEDQEPEVRLLVYSVVPSTNKNSFSCFDMNSRRLSSPSRILEMFMKLFEWHFDVFGLIDEGLAVDINSL